MEIDNESRGSMATVTFPVLHSDRKFPYRIVLLLMAGLAGFIIQARGASAKVIYLTLDADMNQSMKQKFLKHQVGDWYDPAVFKYLTDNRVRATFFVSGLFVETYPDLAKQLVQTGLFGFQNHGYDESGFTPHCYNLATLRTDFEKIAQIQKTQNILKDLTGHPPALFRFPGICHSPHDDEHVKNLGLKIDNGTLIAGDPFNKNTKAIVDKILNRAESGSVILMHVGGPNAPVSLDVLKQIVPSLQKQGFVFEKL